MKCAAVRVVAVSLLLSGASLVHAQALEPAKFLRIFREDIKSGKGAAHEKVETAYARASAKAGYPPYVALNAISGTSQTWFLERHDSYESIEKAIRIFEAEPLKTVAAQLDSQDGDLRSGERSMIATYQKDLSYTPVPALGPKARYYSINMIRIRPGHLADFTEMRRMINAAFVKSASRQRRVVYAVTSGAPVGTYLILAATESLRAMDTPAGAMTMVDAFGAANLVQYNKLTAETVVSTEATLFALNPKMSNPSKEFIAADPDFWAPKPKPAAAKPAAKP